MAEKTARAMADRLGEVSRMISHGENVRLVAEGGEVVLVSERILRAESEYFATALDAGLREGKEKEVVFDDTDITTLRFVAEALLCGKACKDALRMTATWTEKEIKRAVYFAERLVLPWVVEQTLRLSFVCDNLDEAVSMFLMLDGIDLDGDEYAGILEAARKCACVEFHRLLCAPGANFAVLSRLTIPMLYEVVRDLEMPIRYVKVPLKFTLDSQPVQWEGTDERGEVVLSVKRDSQGGFKAGVALEKPRGLAGLLCVVKWMGNVGGYDDIVTEVKSSKYFRGCALGKKDIWEAPFLMCAGRERSNFGDCDGYSVVLEYAVPPTDLVASVIVAASHELTWQPPFGIQVSQTLLALSDVAPDSAARVEAGHLRRSLITFMASTFSNTRNTKYWEEYASLTIADAKEMLESPILDINSGRREFRVFKYVLVRGMDKYICDDGKNGDAGIRELLKCVRWPYITPAQIRSVLSDPNLEAVAKRFPEINDYVAEAVKIQVDGVVYDTNSIVNSRKRPRYVEDDSIPDPDVASWARLFTNIPPAAKQARP